MPEDRRAEAAGGPAVATRSSGSVLFADVSGFTQLTSRLAQVLGARRGAEEVPHHLNRVYDALVGCVRAGGGTVVAFAGDAITCWFPGDDGRAATMSALAMQAAMTAFTDIVVTDSSGHVTSRGEPLSLSLKVSVAAGEVSRFLVGDPHIQLIDVLAGRTVERLDSLNSLARPGQVVVEEQVGAALSGDYDLLPVPDADGGSIVGAIRTSATPPDAPATGAAGDQPSQPNDLAEATVSPWVLTEVRRRLAASHGDGFLTELKPVAALFLRFTGIDYDEDPAAGDKLDALVRWAQAEVDALGGALVQLTVGDKGSYLYATFGAPVAHEDDAVRCAAAALALVRAATLFSFLSGVHLGVGLGVARTGAYGAGDRRTYGALGEETNMAARLMSRAADGTILASDAIRRATDFEFEYLQQAPFEMKGKPEPIAPYLLQRRREHGAATTFDDAAELPFVARERETARLVARIAAGAGDLEPDGRAPTGLLSSIYLPTTEAERTASGGLLAVVGESGIGKSRLVARALTRAAASGVAAAGLEVHAGECQSFERNSPFAVWRPVLKGILGIGPATGDSALPTAESVADALATLGEDLRQRAPLLAPVLGIEVPDNELTAGLSLEQRGAAREALVIEVLRRSARRSRASGRALVVVLEDVHWQDSASGALLAGLARVVTDLPLSVLLTLRIDEGLEEAAGAEALLTLPGLERVDLTSLPTADAAFLAEHVLGQVEVGEAARQSLVAQAVARSEGNPLYLEELLNDLVISLRTGALETDTQARPVEAVLPNSLHSLLLGRIDQLEDEPRSTLKVASVIGRTFVGGWLPACRPERTAAGLLADVEVTRRLGLTAPLQGEGDVHAFKHALMADVAYESLSYAHRAELHTRLARFLEATLPAADARRLGLLAHHYDRSLDALKRRDYLLAAGRYAQAAFANHDAAAYYRRLLPLVTGESRVEVLQLAGEVATFTGAYALAQQHYAEALELATAGDWAAAAARSQRLLGELAERQGDHLAARDRLEAARASCFERGDDLELVHVLLALGGNVLWQLGAYDEARRHLDQAAALSVELGDRRLFARAIHGLGNLDLYQGNTASAKQHFQQTLSTRRKLGDELGVANSLNNLAIVAANLGDTAEAEAAFRDSLEIRRRIGDTAGVAVALNNLGYMAESRGELEAANDLYIQSLAGRRELGDKLGMAVSLNNLGALARRRGDLPEAKRHHRESLVLAHAIGNVREAASGLVGLAAIAAATPTLRAGATLLAAAEQLLSSLGAAMDPDLQQAATAAMENFTIGLDAAILSEARKSGQRMSLDEAIAFALDH